MKPPPETVPIGWLSEVRARSFNSADKRHSQTFKCGILFLFAVGLLGYASYENVQFENRIEGSS